MLPVPPSTQRNTTPILGVLSRLLPPRARVLELACGSGFHSVAFASALSSQLAAWQPTDVGAAELASTDAHRATLTERQQGILAPAAALDVSATPWPEWVRGGSYDVVLAVNLLHISPAGEAIIPALVRGAAAALAPGGLLSCTGLS